MCRSQFTLTTPPGWPWLASSSTSRFSQHAAAQSLGVNFSGGLGGKMLSRPAVGGARLEVEKWLEMFTVIRCSGTSSVWWEALWSGGDLGVFLSKSIAGKRTKERNFVKALLSTIGGDRCLCFILFCSINLPGMCLQQLTASVVHLQLSERKRVGVMEAKISSRLTASNIYSGGINKVFPSVRSKRQIFVCLAVSHNDECEAGRHKTYNAVCEQFILDLRTQTGEDQAPSQKNVKGQFQPRHWTD